MLALIFLLFGFYFTIVFGDCQISARDEETIKNEFEFAVNVLKIGIPMVLGFTYFVFSMFGYSVAVWHLNQRMANNKKEGSLPDEQQKLVDAYKDFKKLVNSIGENKNLSKKEQEENEKEWLNKLSKKESEKQLSNHLEPLLKNTTSTQEQEQQNLQVDDEFNLLPEEPPMMTNTEERAFESQSNPSRPQARQNLNTPVLSPATPAFKEKPEESLDTLRQALEYDRLEAAAATDAKKKEVVVAGARTGDKKNDITRKAAAVNK